MFLSLAAMLSIDYYAFELIKTHAENNLVPGIKYPGILSVKSSRQLTQISL